MDNKEGYDSSHTMYSPDGRMYQVEYAREAIKRGTITCGIVYDQGIILLVEKKVASKLIEPDSIEKIFKIDGHVGCSMSGLVADARVLVEEVRERCQEEKFYYSHPIDMNELIKDISNMIWYYTFDGGGRPIGVGMLIGGIDKSGPHLYSTDPSGAFEEKHAGAIGEKADQVEKILEDNYKENLTFTEALTILVNAISATNENKTPFLEMAKITKDQGFNMISPAELAEALKAVPGA